MRKRIVQNSVIFQIEDGKRGFPVIAVQNIGQVAEFRQKVDDRAAEEGKAQGIIPVTVEPRTVEQMLVADGIDRHTVQLALVQSAGELTLSQMDNTGFNQRKLIAIVFLCDTIHGDHDCQFVPRFLKRRRKGKRHIRQTAGFAKRSTFA